MLGNNGIVKVYLDDKEVVIEEDIIVKLKREFQFYNGVVIIVGVIVGSGIFIFLKGVLMELGSVGFFFIVWVFCGVIFFVGVMCYVELGIMILKLGVDYVYIMELFGYFLVFFYLWVVIMIIIFIGNVIIVQIFVYYVLELLFFDCEVLGEVVILLVVVCISKYMLINIFSW